MKTITGKLPLVAIGLMATFTAGGLLTEAAAQDATPIRIGWQPTTTVESQIAHTLTKTDILEKHGLEGEFILFSYGPAVNEALVSGSIDIGFIGDLPSVSLAAAGASTTVVARQSTFRGAIIATSDSGIDSLKDLRGKQLYGPVGSSIHLAALGMLEEADLTPGVDVQVSNMGFADLSDALKAGRIEAAFVWDPWIENFVQEGLAKVVSEDTSLTMVIAARDGFLADHEDALERFLRAHKEATLFAASNHDTANAWFREPAAASTLPMQTIETATAFDPQWNADSLADIRLAFNEQERTRYLGLGDRAEALGLFPVKPPLAERTDMSVAEQIDEEEWNFDVKSVTVK